MDNLSILDFISICSVENHEGYKNNSPFPHCIFKFHERFNPILATVEKDFPDHTWPHWYKYNNHFEKKLSQDKWDLLPQSVRAILVELTSAPFLNMLSQVTGIKNLIPDPYFIGGGMHMIEPGGRLDVHTDFNYHRDTLLDRRVNLLLYLNSDWNNAWGGELELWDKDMKEAKAVIPPHMGNMVVFSASETSFHGHPNPVTCPPGRYRKSIACYYYTNGRPDPAEAHRTVFMQRPGDPWDADKAAVAMERAKKAYVDVKKSVV